MAKFEVIFETVMWKSVFVDADDREEAERTAADNHWPSSEIPLPSGYELSDRWEVEGATRVGDED